MSTAVSLLLCDDALLSGPNRRGLSIGVLSPMTGVMGIAGSAILNCAVLAAEEAGEFYGEDVTLVLVDAGRDPAVVARDAAALAQAGIVAGFVGTHTSDVRAAVAAALGAGIPYLFTPPREFDDERAGSVLVGTDPFRQLHQALAWLTGTRRHRWALVGNDYVWPRHVHRAAGRLLRDLGQDVVLERLVPVGGVDGQALVEAIAAARADAVLVSLVGRDGIVFHRAVAELGAASSLLRLCSALDESCLLAVGGDDSGMLFTAMPSFVLQDDDRHLRLMEAYLKRFGLYAPVPGGYAESAYEGTRLLIELCRSGLLSEHTPRQTVARLQGTSVRASAVTVRGAGALAQAVGPDLQVRLAPTG